MKKMPVGLFSLTNKQIAYLNHRQRRLNRKRRFFARKIEKLSVRRGIQKKLGRRPPVHVPWTVRRKTTTTMCKTPVPEKQQTIVASLENATTPHPYIQREKSAILARRSLQAKPQEWCGACFFGEGMVCRGGRCWTGYYAFLLTTVTPGMSVAEVDAKVGEMEHGGSCGYLIPCIACKCRRVARQLLRAAPGPRPGLPDGRVPVFLAKAVLKQFFS